MKKFLSFICLFCISGFLSFSMGCATGTTWNHTGITINTVNHAEIKKTANGEIELLQHVTQKKVYLPYATYAPFWVSDIKQKWQYSLQKRAENSISYTFRLRPDKKQPVRVSKLKGFLYFNEMLSSGKMFVNKLNPADIALLKENPFVIRFLSPTGRYCFVIPYAIKKENSGEIRLQCYTPMKPRVIFPYKQNNTYQERKYGWHRDHMPTYCHAADSACCGYGDISAAISVYDFGAWDIKLQEYKNWSSIPANFHQNWSLFPANFHQNWSLFPANFHQNWQKFSASFT